MQPETEIVLEFEWALLVSFTITRPVFPEIKTEVSAAVIPCRVSIVAGKWGMIRLAQTE